MKFASSLFYVAQRLTVDCVKKSIYLHSEETQEFTHAEVRVT